MINVQPFGSRRQGMNCKYTYFFYTIYHVLIILLTETMHVTHTLCSLYQLKSNGNVASGELETVIFTPVLVCNCSPST